jgi:radical SAM superfamily enzyme YgiQ (UPF0313 family)
MATHPQFSSEMQRTALKGLKVTLINMPIREQASPNNPPVGPALLAARLREFGCDPYIIDLNIYRIKDDVACARGLENGRSLNFSEARQLVEDTFAAIGDQHMIGISGLITTLQWQTEVARFIKEISPDSFLVSGGGLATQFRSTLFDWIPQLDAVCHSEGDDLILKIALDVKTIREAGFDRAYKSGALEPYLHHIVGGKPKFLYEGYRPADLDALPRPAYDLLESDINGYPVLENYFKTPVWGGTVKNSSATNFEMKRSISTISSRGCPFACKFCYRGAQGERNYGIRSAQNLADEFIDYIDSYDVDFIGLLDDNFMVNPGRISELADLLEPLARDGRLRWGAHGRLDEAADLRPDRKGGYISADIRRVDEMARGGCIYIGFGAESASVKTLEAMGKGGFILANGTKNIGGHSFPVTMIEGVRNTMNAGVHGNCTWIMGYPGETLNDLKTSIAFIKWQEDEAARNCMPGTSEYQDAKNSINKAIFTATAYPGTEMFKHPKIQSALVDVFSLTIDPVKNEPVPDESYRKYVLELNDASKMICSDDGRPLNYSAMPDDQFVEVRNILDTESIFSILEM